MQCSPWIFDPGLSDGEHGTTLEDLPLVRARALRVRARCQGELLDRGEHVTWTRSGAALGTQDSGHRGRRLDAPPLWTMDVSVQSRRGRSFDPARQRPRNLPACPHSGRPNRETPPVSPVAVGADGVRVDSCALSACGIDPGRCMRRAFCPSDDGCPWFCAVCSDFVMHMRMNVCVRTRDFGRTSCSHCRTGVCVKARGRE